MKTILNIEEVENGFLITRNFDELKWVSKNSDEALRIISMNLSDDNIAEG